MVVAIVVVVVLSMCDCGGGRCYGWRSKREGVGLVAQVVSSDGVRLVREESQ